MKKNIGTKDRLLRAGFGVILLVLAWWLDNWVSWIVLLAALFTFYEAIASWCVVYHFLGKSSCPIDQDKKK